MYINRALLLALALAVVFLPSLEHWMFADPAHWYRPFVVWLAAVGGAYWNQRQQESDEL
jgi:hypothetical protein